MTGDQYREIFFTSHPGFEMVMKRVPEGQVYEEMFLSLEDSSVWDREIAFPDEVTFGYYEDEPELLLKAVREVDEGWVPFFQKGIPVYCAYRNGELASFCLLEDMGTYVMGGKTIKVGGPGCVGTLPRFRRQGIGLAMIRNATDILKQKGYDYSYIHYTGVAPWYAKLGYKTRIRWDRSGLCVDPCSQGNQE